MKPKKIFPDEILQISQISKALGHPVRVHIIKKLSVMNSCCYNGDLAGELNISRSTLSQHLKELKYAGLIQGEFDPPYIKYCLNRTNWEKVKSLFNGLFREAAYEAGCRSKNDERNKVKQD